MRPNAEMSSGQATFDLKAARGKCDLYTSWKILDLRPECEPLCVSNAAKELPAALDEIERLEAAYQKAQNSNLLRKQAYESLEKIANKQRAALKKLGNAKRERGKALVEERAQDGAKLPELCDIVRDELMCPELDGDCEHWEGCPRKDELRQRAREQLRLEGKI